jgi:photosystem II stability/assembly factor-like uncharacterized protein
MKPTHIFWVNRSVLAVLALIVIAIAFMLSGSPMPTGHDESGDARTQFEYFKDWYAPYSEWSPEMQRAAVEKIRQMPSDVDVQVPFRKGTQTTEAAFPWVQNGPFGIEDPRPSPTAFWSGRITSLSFYPSVGLYIGTANGGVWRYEQSLFTLVPIADNLPTLAIGGVAVHPSSANIVYVGTGDYEMGGGVGVYRTSDDGVHWDLLSLSPTPTRVSRVLIAPWAFNTVFVSSNQGIFRSDNDGASWVQVLNKNVSDLASSPDGALMLAGASGDGVYRSFDYGQTWSKLTTDLPSTNIGRIAVTISPSAPLIAYAQIGNPMTDSVRGVYRTGNSGWNWLNVTPSASVLTGGKTKYLAQQGYNNAIVVHPTDPNVVWAGGVFLLRTSNGGINWTNIGATGAAPRKVHPDIHVLFYTSPTRLYVGCDGGVVVTDNEGESWAYIQRLPITQFYNYDTELLVGWDVKFGGTQDNGLIGTEATTTDYWKHRIQGDGIDAAYDEFIALEVFGTINGNSWRYRSQDGGVNWQSVESGISSNDKQQGFVNTYIVNDPVTFSRVYTNAGNYVYWSTNNGNNWSRMNSQPFGATAGKLSISAAGQYLYVPVNQSGVLKKFTNTPPWSLSDISSGLPANRIVKLVSPSRNSEQRAYAIINGVGDNNKVFKTTNAGSSWTNITGNMPDIPVNDLLEYTESTLFVGTDKGAFRSTNAGQSWYRWNSGMPLATRITDLEFSFKSGGPYIVAATFGRSTFERPVVGTDPGVFFNKAVLTLFALSNNQVVSDSILLRNAGDDLLHVTSVRVRDSIIQVFPAKASLSPQESLWFYATVPPTAGRRGAVASTVEFEHNGAGSPSVIRIEGYIGDNTTFRTFVPESLIVKKEVKRKIASTAWCFRLDNTENNRNPATALGVEFKNPVMAFLSHEPFAVAQNPDGSGKRWTFSDGEVPTGASAEICGLTKKSKPQEIKRWFWEGQTVIWEDDVESMRDSVFGEVQGTTLPGFLQAGLGMPNAANFRNEIFSQYPFSREQPLIIGVADPNAKTLRIAYVALAKPSDVYHSLTTRGGRTHDGPARCFDFFNDGREMVGKLHKLTPAMQSNRLFPELLALKLNVFGSQLGKTPPGLGELRFVDAGSRYNGLLVRQIDSLANRYMTYCDSAASGSGDELYTVVRQINQAFSGPPDTISFAMKLHFTGVRPVGDIAFLDRDSLVIPMRIIPALGVAFVPDGFALYQNYPNPFNPYTTIGFHLPFQGVVTLKVYNILGQEVTTLFDHLMMDEGEEEVEFFSANLASGVYFYRLVAEPLTMDDEKTIAPEFIAVKKMLLIK